MRITLLTTVLMVSAVAAAEPAPTESDGFGDSVRQMIAAQIHDPAKAANPGTQLPAGTDGERIAAAIKAYREPPAPRAEPTLSILPLGALGLDR